MVPDVTIELTAGGVTFDVLVEMDLTDRPSYNAKKLPGYDALLCAWWRQVPRYKRLGGPPVVVWVLRTMQAAMAFARAADEALIGRIGVMGTPRTDWSHAGRDHTFLAVEQDIHRGSLDVLALPALPPRLREELAGDNQLRLERRELISAHVAAAGRNPRKITEQEGEPG